MRTNVFWQSSIKLLNKIPNIWSAKISWITLYFWLLKKQLFHPRIYLQVEILCFLRIWNQFIILELLITYRFITLRNWLKPFLSLDFIPIKKQIKYLVLSQIFMEKDFRNLFSLKLWMEPSLNINSNLKSTKIYL